MADLMCHGEKSFTNTGHMRRASYQTVVQWIKDAWNAVPDRIILGEFVKAEILDVAELPTIMMLGPMADLLRHQLAFLHILLVVQRRLVFLPTLTAMGLCRTELYDH
jgi:hypothetical protein